MALLERESKSVARMATSPSIVVLPLLPVADRRAKETVLAMAVHQRDAAQAVVDRLRRELGIEENHVQDTDDTSTRSVQL